MFCLSVSDTTTLKQFPYIKAMEKEEIRHCFVETTLCYRQAVGGAVCEYNYEVIIVVAR